MGKLDEWKSLYREIKRVESILADPQQPLKFMTPLVELALLDAKLKLPAWVQLYFWYLDRKEKLPVQRDTVLRA
jgi:hypothetical protein